MLTYLQQEELTRMRHEELLAQAARARQVAQIPRERSFRWPGFVYWLGDLGRRRVMPRRPVTVDGLAVASRHQAC